jgi:hypothetical protein
VQARYTHGTCVVHAWYKTGTSVENQTHNTRTTGSNCPRWGHLPSILDPFQDVLVGQEFFAARLRQPMGWGRQSLRGHGRAGPAPGRPAPRCQ